MEVKNHKTFNEFLKSEYAWHIVVGIFAFFIIVIASLCSYQDAIAKWESILGCITFIFALFLWRMQIRREYQMLQNDQKRQAERLEDEKMRMLSKRLTIRFLFNGKVVLECKQAMLTDAGDIRALSQQVGSQMIGTRQLDFFPFVKIEEPIKQADKETAKQFWHYTASFTLKSLPKSTERPTDYQMEVDKQLAAGQALYWTPVYQPNGAFRLVDIWSEALINIG